MIQQAREIDAVNNILQNPAFWSDSVIDETLHRFNTGNPDAFSLFNSSDVREVAKNYLFTVSKQIRKETTGRKTRYDVRSLSDFTLPEWVR